VTDKLKLLVLTHNFPRRPGDHAGVFIGLLARHLHRFGIEPIILAPHDPGIPEKEVFDGTLVYRFRYADHDRDEDIAYRGNMQQLVLGSVSGPFKFKRFLDRWRRAALEIVDRHGIDVVGGHWLIPAGMVMKTLAAKRGLPMVLSSHGTDIRLLSKYSGVTYRYFRTFCRQLERWTFVSSFLKDTIQSFDPSLAPVLEVLPLPHDERVFFRDEQITRDPNLIVSVTRFTPQKRVEFLVKAMALVVERRPEARLEIYGTGPGEHDIRALIARFGLDNHITISPPVDQHRLRAAYNRAAIVVLNSYQEGFGLALSEAMMCGAAVIGTASGGIVDIIKHEQRGLLVEPDNSAMLADAITRMLTDISLAEKLSANGHRYANEQYAAGPLAERYARIISDAAGR